MKDLNTTNAFVSNALLPPCRTPGRTADRPDIVRVVAHEDDTRVNVRGGLNTSFVLNSGQYRELSTYSPLYINAYNNKSVMVS